MMDCELCGRYRLSSDVAPMRDHAGRVVMACSSCRHSQTGPRLLESPARFPSTIGALGAVPWAGRR
jgi:hypothetical protein